MHITRIHAAVSHTVPLTHALDLRHNGALSHAVEARDFALKQIRERAKRALICNECARANLIWYSEAFDRSVETLKETGVCREPGYPAFESPCWSKPETADGALA